MDYHIIDARDEDRVGIVNIFNYYIENTQAAFPENKVGSQFYDMLKGMVQGYPFLVAVGDVKERQDAESKLGSENGEENVIGFGFLHRHHNFPVFSRTAEVTYFILPEHTRRGIGTEMLNRLVQDAGKLGIDTILASISSLNEGSIRFHSKNGFTLCGRFEKIGRKRGRDFDVVWMQRFV